MKRAARIVALLSVQCLVFASCSRAERAARPSADSATRASAAAEHAGSAEMEAQSPLPPPDGLVNDYANVIDATTEERLEATVKRLKQGSQVALAVVTVETTGDKPAYEYAMDVARGWRLGSGSDGDEGGGMILLVAVKDRKWEIRWSRNLETTLRDDISDELKQRMNGLFKQGKYGEGIEGGVEAIVARLGNYGKQPAQ
ncbi:MAG TPA: TPM domain-containing protein [Pyrinomonadaceae bacterium]|jgi:uncharacterized membrane protein YgcG